MKEDTSFPHTSLLHHCTYGQETSVVSLASLSDVAADGEASGAERLLALHDGVAPGDGHVVHHPLLHVVLVDALAEKLQGGRARLALPPL